MAYSTACDMENYIPVIFTGLVSQTLIHSTADLGLSSPPWFLQQRPCDHSANEISYITVHSWNIAPQFCCNRTWVETVCCDTCTCSQGNNKSVPSSGHTGPSNNRTTRNTLQSCSQFLWEEDICQLGLSIWSYPTVVLFIWHQFLKVESSPISVSCRWHCDNATRCWLHQDVREKIGQKEVACKEELYCA